MTWDAGFTIVVVESDSNTTVTLLCRGYSDSHPLFSIIHNCSMLLEEDWCCQVVHVYRECNSLANLGHSLGWGTQFLENPPGVFFFLKDTITTLITTGTC
ncbi:hypothetical protein ACOSQ3_021198 [Xanthoceras sorbifolium]